MTKKALVTGVTGQCGSAMAEYLLNMDYDVHGLDRRRSIDNYDNIKAIKNDIKLVEGDITDSSSIDKIIKEFKYDCIINLCAQSHVHVSFQQPSLTADVNFKGVINLLESIRHNSSHTRLVHSSTSEMFGNSPYPQNEQTPLVPVSPYGCAKLAAHHMVRLYHESYKLRCACTICFNMESFRRGKSFVTKKITEWVNDYVDYYDNYCREEIPLKPLELGDLRSKRDWSHVQDSIEGMYRVCYQDMFFKGLHNGNWKSYCIGSGKTNTVKEFLMKAFTYGFDLDYFTDMFYFEGEGLDEVVKNKNNNQVVVKINPEFFRPNELKVLLCDPTLIKNDLGWAAKYSLDDIVKEMLWGTFDDKDNPVKGVK